MDYISIIESVKSHVTGLVTVAALSSSPNSSINIIIGNNLKTSLLANKAIEVSFNSLKLDTEENVVNKPSTELRGLEIAGVRTNV